MYYSKRAMLFKKKKKWKSERAEAAYSPQPSMAARKWRRGLPPQEGLSVHVAAPPMGPIGFPRPMEKPRVPSGILGPRGLFFPDVSP